MKHTIALTLAAMLFAAPQEKTPKGLAGVGLKAEDVSKAVGRGVEFLLTQCADRPLGAGEDLVLSLALLHADGHKIHPELNDKIIEQVKSIDPMSIGTYELGVLSMVIEALGKPEYAPLLKAAAQRLLDTQGPAGSWGYGGGNAPEEGSLKPESNPLKRRAPVPENDELDNSASQYAVLGLYSAVRSSIKIDAEAFKLAAKHYLGGQHETGGWGYKPEMDPYGSMTCAGIASVAVAGFASGDAKWKEHAAIKKGLEWLAKEFTVENNPGKNGEHHFYYLYGLERVGRILDIEFIGDHEWFPKGAKYLLDHQSKEGAFESESDGSPVLATSFAILFLTRATPSLAAPPPPKPVPPPAVKGLLTTTILAAGDFHLVLDASGSMRDRIGGKSKFDLAKDSVAAIIEALPAGSNVGLRVYGHRYDPDERASVDDSELLIPIGPLDKASYVKRVRDLSCKGKTPLTFSLKESIKDLAQFKKGPVTVVLLTDGAEEGADPTGAAAELVTRQPGSVVHVVAFDVKDPPSRKQCEGIAKSGKGRCYSAGKADALAESLKKVFVANIPFEVVDKEGNKIATGVMGDKRELPPGDYKLRCTVRGATVEREVSIKAGETTPLTIDLTEKK